MIPLKKALILLAIGSLLWGPAAGCSRQGPSGKDPALQSQAGQIKPGDKVYLTYLGHSAFLIDNGLKILVDPYSPGLGYGEIDLEADLVIISHEHEDHNYCPGRCGQVLRGLAPSGEWNRQDLDFQGLRIYNVDSYHDAHDGSRLGKNSIFVLEMPGLRIVHLGDLGHRLTEEQRAQIGKVDLLIIPVGGYYTLPVEEVLAVIDHLQPRAVIPVHFRTAHNSHTPIGSVEEFICLDLPCQVKYKDSRICLAGEDLPDPGQTEIWVMEYMLPAEYPGNACQTLTRSPLYFSQYSRASLTVYREPAISTRSISPASLSAASTAPPTVLSICTGPE